MVNMLPDAAGSAMTAGMRGEAAAATSDSAEVFRGLEYEEKVKHLERLREQAEEATRLLSSFQRVEVDYVPYVDLVGKVQMQYFYDTVDAPKLVEQDEGKQQKVEGGGGEAPAAAAAAEGKAGELKQ